MPILTTLGAACARAWGFTSGLVKDQYFSLTSLLLPGNGTNGAQNNTFLDSSTNNFTITRNGNTTQGTFSPFSQTGWGNYFNGSSYINSTGFNFSTSNFTIELFINASSLSAGPQPISGYTSSGLNYTITIETGGVFKFYLSSNGSTWDIASASTLGTGTVGRWHHIVIVRSGSSIRGYFDGTGGTLITNSSAIYNNSTGFYIGAAGGAGGNFTGYFSNVRVLLGTAAYDPASSTITVPTAPFTTGTTNQVLLTCQANRFVDGNTATTAKTITTSGSPSVVAFSPFNPTAKWSAATYGGSGYFDETGDFLNTASNTAFNLGTGDFTWEFWTYLTGTGPDGTILFQPRTPAGIDAVLFGYKSGANYAIYATTNGSSWNLFSNTTIIAISAVLNRWAHWAFVRNGSVYSVYVDGELKTSATSASSISQLTNVFTIMGGIPGYMGGFRFVKGQALATGAFTPPTSPVTTSSVGWTGANVPTQSITGSVNLLLNFTNAGIYDATSKNDLETVGNAQISTTQSKWGGSSMYFDGTGDYLVEPNNINYDFGSGDFTIEFWMYSSQSATGAGIVAKRSGGGGGNTNWMINCATGAINFYASDGTTYQINALGGGTVNNSAWHHVAVTRSGSSFRVFVDGTQVGSTGTWSGTIASTSRPLYVGVDDTSNVNYYAGYIQDLRITKGYARYTSNFTAPTAPFPQQ